MKKGVLFCVGILSLAAFLVEPVAAATDVDFGIKAGVSMSKLKETSASSTLTKPIFGVFVTLNLNKSFAVQPELYYSTFGGRYNYADGLRYDDCLAYIHLPVLAKARLMQKGKVVPIVFAGPAIDFLLSAKSKEYIGGVYQGEEDFKGVLKSTNLGLVFGVGAEMMLAKLKVSLDVRYDLGLANIQKVGSFTRKTESLLILAGVGF